MSGRFPNTPGPDSHELCVEAMEASFPHSGGTIQQEPIQESPYEALGSEVLGEIRQKVSVNIATSFEEFVNQKPDLSAYAEPHGYSGGSKLDPDYVKAMDLMMEAASEVCPDCSRLKPKGVACLCGGAK